jgi:hypothetical protein
VPRQSLISLPPSLSKPESGHSHFSALPGITRGTPASHINYPSTTHPSESLFIGYFPSLLRPSPTPPSQMRSQPYSYPHRLLSPRKTNPCKTYLPNFSPHSTTHILFSEYPTKNVPNAHFSLPSFLGLPKELNYFPPLPHFFSFLYTSTVMHVIAISRNVFSRMRSFLGGQAPQTPLGRLRRGLGPMKTFCEAEQRFLLLFLEKEGHYLTSYTEH